MLEAPAWRLTMYWVLNEESVPRLGSCRVVLPEASLDRFQYACGTGCGIFVSVLVCTMLFRG